MGILRKLASMKSALLLVILGAIALFTGGWSAYSGYHQQSILSKCLSGIPCQYGQNPLQLSAFQASARASLDMGAALASLGVIVLAYSLFLLVESMRSLRSVDRKRSIGVSLE